MTKRGLRAQLSNLSDRQLSAPEAGQQLVDIWHHDGDDGPHYGANVKFNGLGKYRLELRILPPPYAGFLRHTNKETGVKPWWHPIEKSWNFVYVGVGHKDRY